MPEQNAQQPDARPRTLVFAVMPFREEFNDVYKLGIKAACEDAGAYCDRVDEQMYEGMVIERIYQQIGRADVIVADLSAKTPNVFYETGYACGLGKRVILIARSEEDIPLDLGEHAHVIYGKSITRLKGELTKRLQWALENPEENPAKAEFVLEPYVAGQRLADTSEVQMPILGNMGGSVEGFVFKLDLHNPTESPYSQKLGLGVITEIMRNESDAKVITLPGERYLHLLEREITVLPGGWDNIEWQLKENRRYWSQPVEFDIEVAVYAEFGSVKYPLRVDPHPQLKKLREKKKADE